MGNHMKIIIAPVLLVLLFACSELASAQPSRSSPGSTAEQFYRTYLKLQIRGLPDEKQLNALSPMLAPDLKRLFENATRIRDKYIQEHPDDKPPWTDGDLFTSLFEGAQSFKVGTPLVRGNRSEIPIHLVYSEGGSTTRWSDALVLVRTKGRWLVWDILFKGEWAFKQGNSLRSVLSSD